MWTTRNRRMQHFLLMILLCFGKGLLVETKDYIPQLNSVIALIYYGDGKISTQCKQGLATDLRTKFAGLSNKYQQLQKMCTDKGLDVNINNLFSKSRVQTFSSLLSLKQQVHITGKKKEDLLNCEETILSELSDRTKLLALLPTIGKGSSSGCNDVELKDAYYLDVRYFICDQYFYYNGDDHSCVFRSEPVKYAASSMQTAALHAKFLTTTAPSGDCMLSAQYAIGLNLARMMSGAGRKICEEIEPIISFQFTVRLTGALEDSEIIFHMMLIASNFQTTADDLDQCVKMLRSKFGNRQDLEAAMPGFMTQTFEITNCPSVQLLPASTVKLTDITFACKSIISGDPATFDATAKTCLVAKVDPCPDASASKCLEDFSKEVMDLMMTKDPDTTAMCGSIQAKQTCVQAAPEFCREKIIGGMEAYIKQAEMMCVTKEGWVEYGAAATGDCKMDDIKKAVEEMRKTAVGLANDVNPKPSGCGGLSASMGGFSQSMVSCSANIQTQAFEKNAVNLNAIGSSCPTVMQSNFYGKCKPNEAMGDCVAPLQKLALDPAKSADACEERTFAYACSSASMLGCPSIYRDVSKDLVDKTAGKASGCSAYKETCDVAAINEKMKELMDSVNTIEGVKPTPAQCSGVTSQASAIMTMGQSCNPDILQGIKGAMDGYTASSLYKCSGSMAACGQDPAMACTRKLAKDMTDAFLYKADSTSFCGGVGGAAAGMCTSQASAGCKADSVYSSMSSAEGKLIDGAKKACGAADIETTHPLCKTDNAEDIMSKYADKALFDGLTKAPDTAAFCSGLQSAMESSYGEMVMCPDAHLKGGKDAADVYQSLLAQKCKDWKPPKYPSAMTTVDNKVKVTITEGGGTAEVPVKVITNPASVCYTVQDCKVDIKVTVQNDLAPKFITSNKPISQAVVAKYAAATANDFCTFPLTSADYNTEQKIPVLATIEGKKDMKQSRKLLVNYMQIVSGEVVAEREISGSPVEVVDADTLAVCNVVGNTHVTTFDRVYFHNYLSGVFTIYKHVEEPYEVQIINAKCAPKASCICAVAVKSGDDVIVFERCKDPKAADVMRFKTPNAKVDTTVFMNEDGPYRRFVFVQGTLTKGTQIFEKNAGRIMEVSLPTGTTVEVEVSKHLAVHIRPTPYDLEKTTGLCGKYNKKKEDDLQKPDGTAITIPTDTKHPTDLIKAWSVEANKMIFKGVPKDDKLKDDQTTYCACEQGKKGVCAPGAQIQMKDVHWSTSMKDVTQKLITHTNDYSTTFGEVNNAQDILDKIVDTNYNPTVVPWGQNGWTELKAKEHCDKTIKDKEYIKSCMVAVKIEDSLSTCVQDIRVIGNTNSSSDAAESYNYLCSNAVGTKAALSTTELGHKIMDGIQSVCVRDCSGHGNCDNGHCKCNANWVNEDCSASNQLPPYSIQLDNLGLCDLTKGECKTWAIYGNGMARTEDDLKVVLEKVEWKSSGPKRTNDVQSIPAKQQSFGEVVFDVPEPGKSYIVTVSNDGGATYGRLLPLMAYNSTFQRCFPSKGTCLDIDKCINTTNTECFAEYCEETVSTLARDPDDYKKACGDLADKKKCIEEATADCSTEQLDEMKQLLDHLEKKVLITCTDKYYDIMKGAGKKSDTCDPGKAADELNKFLKFENRMHISKDSLGQTSAVSCRNFQGMLDAVNPMMTGCDEVNKARIAQALTYPKAMFNNTCKDQVKWPPWKPLPELDLCPLSPNYKKLEEYTKVVTHNMPDYSHDWSLMCSKYEPDMQTILKDTDMCTPAQMATIKKMGTATQNAIKKNCDATKQRMRQEPPSCKVTEARGQLAKALEDITSNLVRNQNTDKLCIGYTSAILGAKQKMHTCSSQSKTSLDDAVDYNNKMLVPEPCNNYSPVPWPTEPIKDMVQVDPSSHPGLTIDEGGDPGKVTVKWQKDPKTLCGDTKNCSVEVEVGVPKRQSDVKEKQVDDDIPQIQLELPPGKPDSTPGCSILMKSDNWKQQSFQVSATMDMLYDKDQVRHVVVNYKKIVDGKEQPPEEIGRVQVTAKNMDKKAVCQVVADMHTKTFDGTSYSNFQTGVFVAYKHKTLPYQVQVAVTTCPLKTTCICAVVVQSGDDVYLVDRCPKTDYKYGGTCSPGDSCPRPTAAQLRTKLFRNGDLTPGTKILNRDGGQNYKVVLPSSMTVDIIVTESALQLLISPSPKDIGNSQGLCGMYDTNPANDFTKKDGGRVDSNNWDSIKEPKDFVMSWKIPNDKDSIFYGVPAKSFEVPKTCRCTLDGKKVIPHCTRGADTTIVTNWDKTFKDITKITNDTGSTPPGGDLKTRDPSEPPITLTLLPPPVNMNIPKGKWTTETIVKDHCKKVLTDSVNADDLEKCKEVPGATEKDFMTACVNSIKRTGDTKYADDVVASTVESCRSNIIKEPPPKENAPWLEFPPLKSCPNKCSGKGTCTDGKCKCNAGFENSDCSVKTEDPPIFTGSGNDGTCDERKKNCSLIPVAGENIKTNTPCVLEEIKVHEDKPFERTGNVFLMPTVFDNKNQLTCKGTDPPKPGIVHPPNKDITQNNPTMPPFSLSLGSTTPSPDWLVPGPVYLPFDSKCFTCDPKTVRCTRKSAGCVVDGKCYAPYEGIPSKCIMCNPAVATDRLVTSTAPACGGASRSGHNKEKKDVGFLWWLLLLLLLIVLLAILILLCILCAACGCGKKKNVPPAAAMSQTKQQSVFAGITPFYTADGLKSAGGAGALGSAAAAGMTSGAALPITTLVWIPPVKSVANGVSNSAYVAAPPSIVVTDAEGQQVASEGAFGAAAVGGGESTMTETRSTTVESAGGGGALVGGGGSSASYQSSSYSAGGGAVVAGGGGSAFSSTATNVVSNEVAQGAGVAAASTAAYSASSAGAGMAKMPYHGFLVHEGASSSAAALALANAGSSNAYSESTSVEAVESRGAGGAVIAANQTSAGGAVVATDTFSYYKTSDEQAVSGGGGAGQAMTVSSGAGMADANAGGLGSSFQTIEAAQRSESDKYELYDYSPAVGGGSGGIAGYTETISTRSSGHAGGTADESAMRTESHTKDVTFGSKESSFDYFVRQNSSEEKSDAQREVSQESYRDLLAEDYNMSSKLVSSTTYNVVASEADTDSLSQTATSIYEANGQKAGFEDKKVFLGALVSGKFLKRSQDEVPLFESLSRREDMHVNPIFVDDAGNSYVTAEASSLQPPSYDILQTGYNSNAPMYTIPVQAMIMPTQPQVMVPTQPYQQQAFVMQNLPQPMMAVSPQLQRAYHARTTSGVESNASHASATTSLDANSITAYSVNSANHSSTLRSASGRDRDILVRDEIGRLRREQSRSATPEFRSAIDEDDFYFVGPDALEQLHISEDNIEEYVYEMIKNRNRDT